MWLETAQAVLRSFWWRLFRRTGVTERDSRSAVPPTWPWHGVQDLWKIVRWCANITLADSRNKLKGIPR